MYMLELNFLKSKSFKISCFLVIFLIGFSSCKTSKDIVYLNNVVDKELIDVEYNKEYRLKVDDNLYIDIHTSNLEVRALFNPMKPLNSSVNESQTYANPTGQYFNGYQVDKLGNIQLPILGEFKVIGKTLKEVQLDVQKAADVYLKDAIVKIKLLSFKVTVLGEVKSPGVYYNYNEKMTILEAVSMANGITDYGRIKKVLVMRVKDQKRQIHRLDLTDKKFLSSDAFFLQPEDVLYVEPDQYKNIKLNFSTYSIFLSTLSTILLLFKVL